MRFLLRVVMEFVKKSVTKYERAARRRHRGSNFGEYLYTMWRRLPLCHEQITRLCGAKEMLCRVITLMEKRRHDTQLKYSTAR